MDQIEFKKFDESNLADACKVVRQVFNEDACEILKKGVENPNRELLEKAGSGEIVYEDGNPIGFHAAFPRYFYIGKEKNVWVSGSTLCVSPKTKVNGIALKLLQKTQGTSRANSIMFVGNTINSNRVKLNKLLRVKDVGPDSCATKRIAVIRKFDFFKYLFFTKVLKIEVANKGKVYKLPSNTLFCCQINDVLIKFNSNIPEIDVDKFWEQYLESNIGVVSSRTSKELRWIFADRLRDGRAAFLGAYNKNGLIGYLIVSFTNNGKIGKVLDMIALQNKDGILDAILRGLRKFLRTKTRCVHCQISGYNDRVQSIISKHFTLCRKLDNNASMIFIQDKGEKPKVTLKMLKDNNSWFFGPYDGDACML